MKRSMSTLNELPVWRKMEIGCGLLRAVFRHHQIGLRRVPIIHPDVKLRRANGRITLGHLSEIHERVVLSAMGKDVPAIVNVGACTSIWYGTVISARYRVDIGSHCAISWNCTIIDNDMHEIVCEAPQDGLAAPSDCEVVIADHVWIGASATILKGVHIGANSVIAAGALVTKDVPSSSLAVGSPARVVRRVAGWA